MPGGRATQNNREPHPAQPAPLISHPSSSLHLHPPFPSAAPQPPPTAIMALIVPIPPLDHHLSVCLSVPRLSLFGPHHPPQTGRLQGHCVGSGSWFGGTRRGGDTLAMMDTPGSCGILLHPLRPCQGHGEHIQGTRRDCITLDVPRGGLRSGRGYSRHPRQQPSLTRQLRTNIPGHGSAARRQGPAAGAGAPGQGSRPSRAGEEPALQGKHLCQAEPPDGMEGLVLTVPQPCQPPCPHPAPRDVSQLTRSCPAPHPGSAAGICPGGSVLPVALLLSGSISLPGTVSSPASSLLLLPLPPTRAWPRNEACWEGLWPSSSGPGRAENLEILGQFGKSIFHHKGLYPTTLVLLQG